MPAGFDPLEWMRKLREYNNPSAGPNGALSNDPRMMEDEELNQMSFKRPPALTQQSVNNGSPDSTGVYTPPRGASNNTGNARGSSISRPDEQIGFNEMMIRTGGAMMGGARDGGLAAYSAATDEYGNIQDANRTNALTRYEEEIRARTALNKANAKNTPKGTDPNAGRLVNNEIVRTLNMVDQDLDNGFFDGRLGATGMIGSVTQLVPGTRGYDLKQRILTIQSNIGFDKLQDMRDKSPTGGALGQVSEMELKTLQAVIGSLDQSQSTGQLKYNLQRLQFAYNEIIHGNGNHPYREPDPTQEYSSGNSTLDNEVESILNN
tara:strand:+ start:3506 stop:4465 length:960 start_codon:yes stop_codon:yes gene_type:complete